MTAVQSAGHHGIANMQRSGGENMALALMDHHGFRSSNEKYPVLNKEETTRRWLNVMPLSEARNVLRDDGANERAN